MELFSEVVFGDFGGGEFTDLPTTSNGPFSEVVFESNEVVFESNLNGDFGGGDIGGSSNHFPNTVYYSIIFFLSHRDLINLYF